MPRVRTASEPSSPLRGLWRRQALCADQPMIVESQRPDPALLQSERFAHVDLVRLREATDDLVDDAALTTGDRRTAGPAKASDELYHLLLVAGEPVLGQPRLRTRRHADRLA